MKGSYFGSILIAAMLSGCAAAPIPQQERVVAADARSVVVAARQGDTYASLAEEFLQDAHLASHVAKFNGHTTRQRLNAGRLIAIPMQPRNAAHVYPDGYQVIPILCYHRFSNNSSNDPLVVSKADFTTQMQHLAEAGFKVLPLAEVAAFQQGDKPFPEKAVVITVDDGYRSFAEIAYPILQRFDFPATVFVYADFVGGGLALNWSQIKELADSPLVDIQSHSKTHNSLFRQPEEPSAEYGKRLQVEIDVIHSALRRRVGITPRQFAYPYGETSPEMVQALAGKGYRIAATVTRGETASFHPPLLLRRSQIYGQDDFDTFKRRLSTFKRTK